MIYVVLFTFSQGAHSNRRMQSFLLIWTETVGVRQSCESGLPPFPVQCAGCSFGFGPPSRPPSLPSAPTAYPASTRPNTLAPTLTSPWSAVPSTVRRGRRCRAPSRPILFSFFSLFFLSFFLTRTPPPGEWVGWCVCARGLGWVEALESFWKRLQNGLV